MTEGAGTAARRTRIIAYWVFTLIVAWEMIAGGFWALLRIEYVRVMMTHLGYPLYALFITGIWKIPCGAALLAPRFARLKEWAYAGAFFNYTGAVASHIAVGDRVGQWAPPLVFALFALASWALRPASRRLERAGDQAETGARQWAIAAGILVAMAAVALATLPKGPSPP
ncbi:MAG TPA: DoxX family protein [Edaphobacter sp.]